VFSNLDFTNVKLWLVLLEFSVDDDEAIREMVYRTLLKSSNEDFIFPLCYLPEKIICQVKQTDRRQKTFEMIFDFANNICLEGQDQVKEIFFYF